MAQLQGLPPIAGKDARVLILGSFPSEASLRERQYYGHPRNQFWVVMERLFGIARGEPYLRRCRELVGRRVAVWDVIGRCRRRGSLDSAIRAPEANDFAGFYRQYPQIVAVFFNGAAAEKHYRALVGTDIAPAGETTPADRATLTALRLPSTSPANASITLAAKTAQWQTIRAQVETD